MSKKESQDEKKLELLPEEEEIVKIDKKLIKQRAVKTLYATAGTLAVAIPINVAFYYALVPFNFMPPDVLAAIGFVIGLVVGLNTGWNVGLKKGREAAAKIKDE